MDNSDQRYLEQRSGVGALKLSEAIRRGKKMIAGNESRTDWTLCAIGCAFIGVHGRRMSADDLRKTGMAGSHVVTKDFAEIIGFPMRICEEVNWVHQNGTPALAIADRLESQGL